MGLHHIRLDRSNPEARLSGATMPRLEFRQALFRTPRPGWQRRLYTASLVVTTTALGVDDRRLAVDHQSFRFSLLYNASWPEPRVPGHSKLALSALGIEGERAGRLMVRGDAPPRPAAGGG